MTMSNLVSMAPWVYLIERASNPGMFHCSSGAYKTARDAKQAAKHKAKQLAGKYDDLKFYVQTTDSNRIALDL